MTAVQDRPEQAPDGAPAPPRAPIWPQVPERPRWEGPLWLLGGVVSALLMFLPLARQLDSTVANSTEDPLAQSWHMAWIGHALKTDPTGLFGGNVYWPDGPALAFADSMLGYAPFALIGEGPTAALVRYNVVFLFAYALVFAAAGLLAREVGLRVPPAAVVAVAAAYTPTRAMQNNHLNILSVGGIVLAVFLLTSGYRRGRGWQVLCGWAVAAWQMSIGFAMGIWFAYLLALLALLLGIGWLRRGRPPVPPPLLVATLVGAGGFALATLLLLLPYLGVIQEYPEASARERFVVEFFSPPPRAAVVAVPESRLWGDRTKAVRDTLQWPTEQALFPGLTVLVLAGYGLRWRGAPRTMRVGLGVFTGAVLLLGFGPNLEGGLLYDAFYELAPGWKNIRTTGRLAFLWSLTLALLAGFGAQRLGDWLHQRRGPGGRAVPPGSGTAVALGLAAVLAYEGSVKVPLLPVDPPPLRLADLAGPQWHVPSAFRYDSYYMYWSTDGFPTIANGAGSFDPPKLAQLWGLTSFPDPGSVDLLRQRGIETVVVHRERLPGSGWEAAPDKPVDGLGITREDRGGVVVYDLTP